jgi:hypothetical protein
MVDKMRKLYYTCPIKALYMMKEFGVKLKVRDVNGSIGQHFSEIIATEIVGFHLHSNPEIFIPKFYIAPESEKIFEPQEDDIAINPAAFYHSSKVGIYRDDAQAFVQLGDFDYLENAQIIMRDNKCFFAPEIENKIL